MTRVGRKADSGGRTQRLVHVPSDLNEEMKRHPEVNWSRVAETAFRQQLGQLGSGIDGVTNADLDRRLKQIEEIVWGPEGVGFDRTDK